MPTSARGSNAIPTSGSAGFKRDTYFGGRGVQPRCPSPDAGFNRYAFFSGASFNRDAYFWGAGFNGTANFGDARFNGDADFEDAGSTALPTSGRRFNGHCQLRGCGFNGYADFGDSIQQHCRLKDSEFNITDIHQRHTILLKKPHLRMLNFRNTIFNNSRFKEDALFENADL